MISPQEQQTLAQARQLAHGGDASSVHAAVAALEKVRRRHPHNIRLASEHATYLARLEMPDRGASVMQRAMRAGCDDPVGPHTLALMHQQASDFEAAAAACERAFAIEPGYLPAIALRAEMLITLNRHQEAYEVLEPVLGRASEHPGLAIALGRMAVSIDRSEQALELLHGVSELDTLDPRTRAEVWFRIANILDTTGEHKRAFDAAERANAAVPVVFDPDRYRELVDALIARWQPVRLEGVPRSGLDGSPLVYVLGAPRSGTSLVEAILSAHPAVHATGESAIVERLIQESQGTGVDAGGGSQRYTLSLTAKSLKRMGEKLLARYRRLDPRAQRFTDKRLSNVEQVGLLSLLVPGMRVVHCRRDPRDVALSCYFQHFRGGAEFSYSIEHTAAYLEQYDRMMDHWRVALGVPMLEVRYEELVQDPEAGSRRLLEFVGLEWHDKCLRFYETEHVTKTISHEQVRQPVYARSVGRWSRYAEHLAALEPLAEAYGTEGERA